MHREILARSMADEHSGNGEQQDLPIQTQGPIINVLHIHAHPRLEVELVAPGHRPQAGQPRPHADPTARPREVSRTASAIRTINGSSTTIPAEASTMSVMRFTSSRISSCGAAEKVSSGVEPS